MMYSSLYFFHKTTTILCASIRNEQGHSVKDAQMSDHLLSVLPTSSSASFTHEDARITFNGT